MHTLTPHGGNLACAIERYGTGDWVDLSAGLSPYPYPVPPLAHTLWQRLPAVDPALLRAACAYYGAPALLAVAGTQAAIQALPRLRSPSRVVVATPTYAEHPARWTGEGHAVRRVAYAALDDAIAHCDVAIVCNPNNPGGQKTPPAQLLAWSARLAARGGWLIVDEAFGDTDPALSVAAHSARAGLIVLRSVGKFFGLAGLRLGFVGAEPALLARLAAELGPWSVSAPAQQIALAALQDHGWQTRMRRRLRADGARLAWLLQSHGIRSRGGALFRYWPTPHADALHDFMARRRLWLRRFDEPAGGALRCGLPPDSHAWQRLAVALADWQHKGPTR